MDLPVEDWFDGDDFATPAILVVGGESRAVQVILDAEAEFTDVGGARAENTRLTVLCKSTDTEDVNHSSTVEIDAVIYKVIEIHPTQTGTTTLVLSRD